MALRRAALLLLFEAVTARAHDAKARELCDDERFLITSAGLSLGAKPDLLQALGASGIKGMTCETASDVVEGTKESNASSRHSSRRRKATEISPLRSKPARPPRKPRAPGTRWSAMLVGGAWEAGLNIHEQQPSQMPPCVLAAAYARPVPDAHASSVSPPLRMQPLSACGFRGVTLCKGWPIQAQFYKGCEAICSNHGTAEAAARA